MGRVCLRLAVRILEAFVLQVCLLLLKPSEAVSRENQVLEYCNLSTKAAVLLPLNDHFRDQEALQGKLKVNLSNTDFAPGIRGEQGGAIVLEGHQNSYVEIEADEQIHFDQSITILCHIYPLLSQTGPIVHYNADDVEQGGVMIWMQGNIGGKAQLMARFKPRNMAYATWMKAVVLNIEQWNFIGASYDHVTGWAYLYHDGVEVQTMYLGKNKHLATQHEIRIGAVSISTLSKYKGRFACLQLYSEALQLHEILAASNACIPVVPLQLLSLNLTTPAHVAEVNETMLTVKASANTNATKPTFCFDWGDGEVTQETFSDTANHMYRFSGTYTLHVQAWSLCNTSSLYDNATILVPTPVQILKNLSLQSESTVFGEITQFRLFLSQGSHFKCLWLLGDHVNGTTSGNDSQTMVLNHTYSAPANYVPQVTCRNRRSQVIVNTTVPVQSIITGLRIHPIPPILFGREFKIRWEIQNGTGVTYKAHFSDIPLNVDTQLHDGSYGEARVTQLEYKTPGEFLVRVATSNAVTKWISALAKCNIFRAVSPFKPDVRHQARDIEINETFMIWFSDVNSGPETNASYLVMYGDNSEVVATLENFVNHSYGLHGLYAINITAINDVSSFNTSINIKVHKPVLKLEGARISPQVTKLFENATITIFFPQGSDFVCHWKFGDGRELKQSLNDELIYFKDLDTSVEAFTNVSVSAEHVFKRVGVYHVTAMCQNRLSNVTTVGVVTVQEEIKFFQVSPVGPIVFGKTFSVHWSIASGTNVTFKAYLSQQDLHIENQDFHYLSRVTPAMYKQPGIYNITITAENLVTLLLSHTQLVAIEIPVSDVYINMSYIDGGILHAGHGVNMNIFPEGVPVVFEAITSNGSSLQYTWSISGTVEQFEHKRIEYTFNTPGIYTASIRVGNQLSQVASSVVIAVQKPASFLNGDLECSSPKVRQEIVTIQTTIEIRGTNSSLLIEVDNSTSYWYGSHENSLISRKHGMIANYRGELKRISILHHVYRTKGVYNITVSLGNDVSKSSINCVVEILSRPCKKPEIALKGVGNSLAAARSFFAVDVVEIEAKVEIFCPESNTSAYEWGIFQYHPETGLFSQFGNVVSYGEASMRELRLKKRALPLGVFRLNLTVRMVGEDLQDFFAVAEGYIQIVQSELVAKISGGSEIKRRFGSVLSVDGLDSHDPDVGAGNYSGMSFAWLCRNTFESFPEVAARIINGSVDIRSDISSGFSDSSGQGCYRDGQYLLSNATMFKLKTSRMVPGETYEIALVVRKDNRTSFTTQLLELNTDDVLNLTIRCVVNCEHKVNPSDKLSISTDCPDRACQNTIRYSWSLFFLQNQRSKNPTWQLDNETMETPDISSSVSFPNMVIKKHSLHGNTLYKLVVIGSLPNGIYGRASYTFQVNAPPTDGACHAKPRVGHVLTTHYKVWCTGWHDPDAPLKYEIIHVQGTLESLLYYGGDAEATVSLPLGDGQNYIINITVRISDRLGAVALFRLQVQSLPPILRGAELMNHLFSMTTGDNSPLRALQKSGKNQDVARMAGSICSVLKQEPKLTDAQKVRDSLTMALTDQRTTSVKAVQLVSGSLYQVTQVANGISLEAQEAGTFALSRMATVLDRESQDIGSDSADAAAASVFGTIGNLLGPASDHATVNQSNDTNTTSSQNFEQETKRLRGKFLVKKLFSVLNFLAASVLRRKIPFEDSTEISTPHLAMSLKSATPSIIGGKVSVGYANFDLPNGNDMFRRAKPGLASVNQKVFSMPRNYFTYDETSEGVNSPVVSLSYEDKDKEEAITVSNLKSYIEYSLPGPDVLPESHKYSVKVTENTWAYHKLFISSKDEAVNIEVTPFNCSHKLHVYVRENRQPTKDKFAWKKVISEPSSGHRPSLNYSTCFQRHSSYTLFISNTKLRQSTYFIGIWYANRKQDTRNSNETDVMKYSIRVLKLKCLYWNERKESWMGEGCIVGPLTSPKRIHCMTNHLTSFGSGMFVAPNPIDFSKALLGFATAFQSGNVVVMFTILTLLILYSLLAVWAWRADKRDAMQIGATILPVNRPNSNYLYEILFVTGSRNGSGTTAHVGCEIFGESDNSGPCYLLDPNRSLFRRGDFNVFIISVPKSLGVIRGVRIWHDNSGKSPSWFFNRAMLRDSQTGENWIFLAGPGGRWLDVAEEDGKVDIVLRPATGSDMISFKKIFNTKIRKEICDNHLWFSVAYRPARSQFTRLQRLSCCLSLLFSFMVATAMFYGSGPQPGDTSGSVQMGPIKINIRMLIIGIESALVVVPVNILIVTLFRNSKGKERRTRKIKGCYGYTASQTSKQNEEIQSINSDTEGANLDDIHCNVGSEKDFENSPEEKSANPEGGEPVDKSENSEDESLVETQDRNILAKIRAKFHRSEGPCFPYWCVYVGWVLCMLTTLLSAVFTLFYSMMWGKEQSNMWLTTMAISFVQDTLISQPLKVLILSLIYAVYSKSPDEDKLEELSVAKEDANEVEQDLTNDELARYDPPSAKILKVLRIREIRRRQTIKLFTDLSVYVILLAMVMILSFQYRNPASYKMINTLRRVFVDPIHNSSYVRFDQVNTVSSIWDWTRQTMLPGLHPGPLYDGLESEPYIADRMSLQLGVARLRQVRLKKGTCEVNTWFKDIFSQCNGFYSVTKDDTKFYDSRWENATEQSENMDKGNIFSFSSKKTDHVYTPWEHIDNFEAHHVLPVIGKFSTYSGGGYVMNLNSSVNVDHQQDLSWLDSRSRAVHAEFVAYNPTINMVAAVTITFELPPLGGVFSSFEAFTVSMYGSLRKHRAARITGEVIAAIVLVFMIYRVTLTIFHDKCQYFKDPAKVLDLIFVFTGIVIVFLKVLKEGFKKLATDQFNENPKQFLDFYQCGFYDELTDYAFAFLNFIAIVRFSVFLKFLGCLEHILTTIARCFYDLLGCLFVFVCLMMAFTSMFSIAFNGDSDNFKDFSSSLQTSISYMARMVRTKEVVTSHTVVRAVALFSCCVTLIFFYFTMIRSVFIVGYRKTLMEDRGREKEKSFESGIYEIFMDKFLEITGMEREKEEIVEKEDPVEVRLRSQKNYIDKSQFRRLRHLINEVYTADFVEDLRLFEAMHLNEEPQTATRKSIDVQEENTNLTNRPKYNGNDETRFEKVDDDGGRGKTLVRFNLRGQEVEQPTKSNVQNKTSMKPTEADKLSLLEKLVQEKMTSLQRKQEESTLREESGSVEREIQMLARLKQRIDAQKGKTPVLVALKDATDGNDDSNC